MDQPLVELPDGTWSLMYSAHRSNTGAETYGGWNKGLMNNLQDGVPVGVYIEDERRQSRYYRALAYVESFIPEHGCFVLRGPISAENESSLRSPLSQLVPVDGGMDADDLLSEMQSYELVRRAKRAGQERFKRQLMDAYDGACAITGCGVPETLQAAHIIGHRGLATNVASNGLLLRADIHLLYDHGLLSIEPDIMRVVTSGRLARTEYSQLDGIPIRLPSSASLAPRRDYLAVKYQEFMILDSAS